MRESDPKAPTYTLLDLFAGLHGWSEPFEESPRWEVFTVDQTSEFTVGSKSLEHVQQDLVTNIGNLSPAYLPSDVDLLVASVPCTTFTLAALGTHRHDKNNHPKTMKAAKHETLVKHTLELIEAIEPTYYVIENPRAKLRKMDFMPDVAAEVTWCQYEGSNVMKPTDLFGELPQEFDARKCANGDDCHEAAPRGSNTGTQGKGTSAERAKIPVGLSMELLESTTAALDRARGITAGNPAPFFGECGTCGNHHKSGARYCPAQDSRSKSEGSHRIDSARFQCPDGHLFFRSRDDPPDCPYCHALTSDESFSYPIWKEPPGDLADGVGEVVTPTCAGRSFAVPENFELLPPWTEERSGWDERSDQATKETVKHYAAYHRESSRTFPILKVVVDEWHSDKGHHRRTGWWTDASTIEPAREPESDIDVENTHGDGLARFT